jgi:hypothetical protein
MQLGFFSTRALRFHHVITFMLLIALSFQGLLVSLRVFDQPLWLFCLLFFIPFAPNYIKFFIRLPLQIIAIYFCLILTGALISFIAIYINGGIANYNRLIVPFVGIGVSFIFFYNYSENINLLIKQIIILLTIMGFISVIQYYFNFDAFEFYTRKHESLNAAGELIIQNRDRGSTGGFGFPTSYGYFLTFFYPIIYAYCLFSFPKNGSIIKKTLYIFPPILIYLSLLLSMQRAAILAVIVSMIFISFAAFKFKKALIIFIILPLSTQIVFQAMQGHYERILNVDNIIHTQLNYDSGGMDERYRGGKVLFDITAVNERLWIIYSWYKAYKVSKVINSNKIQNNDITQSNFKNKTPNTYELRRILIKEIKSKPSVESALKVKIIPPTAHSYYLNIDMNYGRIALISVFLCYFSMVASVARIFLLDHKLKYISLAYMMAIINYLAVTLVHNNGHFLLDLVGWIGIGSLIGFIHHNTGNAKENLQ